MNKRTGYPDGAPCWTDLSTPDLDGARRFYAGLLGWTFDEPEAAMGHYTTARKDGLRAAGIAPKMEGMDMPTMWSVYLRTGDADALARRIGDAGGQIVVPPMEIPGQGRMLFAIDPTGAAFGAWEPASHTGAEAHDDPGAMCWHELNTRDAAKADAFYRSVFGYDLQQIGDGEVVDYVVFNLDGKAWGGRMKLTTEWGDAPSHWMTYFRVEDADAAVTRVGELGGKLLHAPFDSPHGRIAVVSDPWGAVFSVIGPTPTPAA